MTRPVNLPPITPDTALVAQPAVRRRNDPQKTRENILDVALAEFVEHGLSGARVDAIAERTRTSKRMIYYYFESKENLYLKVLERFYAGIRTSESQLHLAGLEPREAIRRLVEFTFDHHSAHRDFVRIICIENIHRGEYVRRSARVRSMTNEVLETLGETLRRGEDAGVFRIGLNPLDVHLFINSFCFYRNSNIHTINYVFDIDLDDQAILSRHRELICDAVLRYLQV